MPSSTSQGRTDLMTSQFPLVRSAAPQRGRWALALAGVLALALTSVADARPGDRGSRSSARRQARPKRSLARTPQLSQQLSPSAAALEAVSLPVYSGLACLAPCLVLACPVVLGR